MGPDGPDEFLSTHGTPFTLGKCVVTRGVRADVAPLDGGARDGV